MTFRLRVTLLAALAVAVTAIAAAGLIYAMVQHQLLNEIDDSLVQSANSARQGSSADRRFPGRSAVLYLSGRYDMFAQIVDTSGRIVPSEGQPGSPELVDTVIRDVANGAPATFTDIHTSDTHWRVYAMPLGPGRARPGPSPERNGRRGDADARSLSARRHDGQRRDRASRVELRRDAPGAG